MARIWLIISVICALLTQGVYAAPRADTERPQKRSQSTPQVVKKDVTKDLDFLFGALRAAPDGNSATYVEALISQVWHFSNFGKQPVTISMLMERAEKAVSAKETDASIKLLSSVTRIAPDYFQAWAHRAELYVSKQEYRAAVLDIQQVLAREPRHFPSLLLLGKIMLEIGEEKRAYDVFRLVLKLDPNNQTVPQEFMRIMRKEIMGRDI